MTLILKKKNYFLVIFFPFFFDSKYLLTNMLQLTDVFHTKLICLWSLLNWRKKSWPEKAETERAQPFHSFTHFFPPKMKYISVRFCKWVSNLSPLSSQMLLTVLLSNKGSKINSGSFWFEKIIMLSITSLCALLLQNFTTISLSRVNVFTVSFNFEICEISEMQLPNPTVFKFMS